VVGDEDLAGLVVDGDLPVREPRIGENEKAVPAQEALDLDGLCVLGDDVCVFLLGIAERDLPMRLRIFHFENHRPDAAAGDEEFEASCRVFDGDEIVDDAGAVEAAGGTDALADNQPRAGEIPDVGEAGVLIPRRRDVERLLRHRAEDLVVAPRRIRLDALGGHQVETHDVVERRRAGHGHPRPGRSLFSQRLRRLERRHRVHGVETVLRRETWEGEQGQRHDYQEGTDGPC